MHISAIPSSHWNLQSQGAILTCVGSLEKLVIRTANLDMIEVDRELNAKCDSLGSLEIVSLVGTYTQDGIHLHIRWAKWIECEFC